MIVDDVPQNLQLLEGILRNKGWQVFALPSGEMALKAAVRERPDVILLDVLMPGMDGYEVCTRLKADPQLKDIPVLFLSAHQAVPDRRGGGAGAGTSATAAVAGGIGRAKCPVGEHGSPAHGATGGGPCAPGVAGPGQERFSGDHLARIADAA
ncbi:MAG: response regulator [Verrucomicrobia bacterium]|nr:response regulator [Verrucomicrobiota bacterium]